MEDKIDFTTEEKELIIECVMQCVVHKYIAQSKTEITHSVLSKISGIGIDTIKHTLTLGEALRKNIGGKSEDTKN